MEYPLRTLLFRSATSSQINTTSEITGLLQPWECKRTIASAHMQTFLCQHPVLELHTLSLQQIIEIRAKQRLRGLMYPFV